MARLRNREEVIGTIICIAFLLGALYLAPILQVDHNFLITWGFWILIITTAVSFVAILIYQNWKMYRKGEF